MVKGITGLRALSCMAIVLLHILYSSMLMFGAYAGTAAYSVSSAVVNNLMWAVPCFVMITGALLLDERRQAGYDRIFKKYMPRIIFALVIFSFIFRFYDMVMNHEKISAAGVFLVFKQMLTGSGWSHMWYLYLILAIYLLIPIYKKIVVSCSDRELHILTFILILFLCILPLLNIFKLSSAIYIDVQTVYPLYLLMGYEIFFDRVKIKKGVYLGALIASTVLLIALTVIRNNYGLTYIDYLFKYSSPLVFVQALSIFALAARSENSVAWIDKLLATLDNCSFGIYLVHMIFVRSLIRYEQINIYTEYGIIKLICMYLGTLVASYLVVRAMKLIPVLKRVL